jgi:hypothetical protein
MDEEGKVMAYIKLLLTTNRRHEKFGTMAKL